MLLGTFSLLGAVLTASLAVLTGAASSGASAGARRVRGEAGAVEGFAVIGWALSERVFDGARPPIAAEEFPALFGAAGGWSVEDEGGKLPLPEALPAIFPVCQALGLPDPQAITTRLAEYWNLPVMRWPHLLLPLPQPSVRPRVEVRAESVEELAALMGVPAAQVGMVRKYFTAYGQFGVNVNTAEAELLDGLAAWWRASLAGWADAPAQLTVDPTGATAEVEPLPCADPVVVFNGAEPFPTRPYDMFNTTGPSGLAVFASPPFPLRQFAWLHQGGGLPPGEGWYHENWGIRLSYFREPYRLEMHPQARGAGRDGAGFAAERRLTPFRGEELTQTLALLWVTPESWWTPVSPIALNESTADPGRASRQAALSAGAFAGWIALQGPAWFRASSERYTLSRPQGGGVLRWIVQPLPNRPPRLLAMVEDLG